MTISLSRHLLLPILGLLLAGVPVEALAQIEEIPRPERAHAASFGVSVALGDSIAVVGASGEEVCGENSGAVYVYERTPRPQFDTWRVAARLTPRPCRDGAFFGEQVALSGSRVLVSASSEHFADEGTNSAYIFERDPSGVWRQTARFTGDSIRREGLFAADIDLDGDRAVVSTSGNPDGAYGGAVYVYEHDPETKTWSRSARLTASRGVEEGVFGQTVSLFGDRLAVAASTYFEGKPGAVYVFRRNANTGEWHETGLLRDIRSFLIDLDLYGSVLIVGEDLAGDDRSGQATLYMEEQNGIWGTVATLHPSFPYESGSFGAAVSVEGTWALVTGYDEQLDKEFNIDRVVYVFRRRGGRAWTQHTILDIGQVDFGAALDQHGSMALISAIPAEGPGAVYVVQLH